MSIVKLNSAIPDTLRDFTVNRETFPMPESLFVHLKGFSFTEAEILDIDFWYDNLGINIFPLHRITEFNSEDEQNVLVQSVQGFTWKSKKGTYRHRVQFNFSVDYHNMIYDISGIELYVIYTASNMIRATMDSDGTLRGFSLSAFEVEPYKFTVNNSTGNSEIYIEHKDSDEMNLNVYQAELDWIPKRLDRLPVTIEISYTASSIVLTVKYMGSPVLNIKNSDITVTDNTNGVLTFTTFVPGNGIYKLSDFDIIPVSGIISITSGIYMGCVKFVFNYILKEGVEFLLMSGDSFMLMNDSNFLLMTETVTLSMVYGGFITYGNGHRRLYFRITDSSGNIIEDLDKSYFTATSGNISDFSYINNGVYTWRSGFDDTGTLTLKSDDYLASMDWDLTDLFYEANMEAMFLHTNNKDYVTPGDFSMARNQTLTNPDNDKWDITIGSGLMDMSLTDLDIGTNYDLKIDVESISETGTFTVYHGTTLLQTITGTGLTTINFTATVIDLAIRFKRVDGNMETTINSIKIEIN